MSQSSVCCLDVLADFYRLVTWWESALADDLHARDINVCPVLCPVWSTFSLAPKLSTSPAWVTPEELKLQLA